MEYRPHSYQRRAEDFLIEHPAAGLFLDMGLGKTVITLSAIERLLHEECAIDHVLIIAPLRVAKSTWPDEILKWDHTKDLRFAVAVGTEKQRLAAISQQAEITIINRENVPWLVSLIGKSWSYDLVVIDELSSFKSAKSQRFRALRKVRKYIRRIVGLTGTPTPNGLIDLWPQMYLLDMGQRLFQTLGRYRATYFIPGRRNQNVIYEWILREGADQEILRKIEDVCLSMRAADYLELPPRLDHVISVRMPESVTKQYKTLEKDQVLTLDGASIVGTAAAIVTNKLLQLANGAVYDDEKRVIRIHDEKLGALEDLIEAANGQPVLVYYSYKHDLERIRERFPEAVELCGEDEIRKWNSGRIPLLLAHPASAGHGLNLQDGGHILIWFGLPWSLVLY